MTGIFDASNFGPACLQINLPASRVSEDCLTINIVRPSNLPENASLPVMFWYASLLNSIYLPLSHPFSRTYGGGFHSGTGAQHNGSVIVEQSVRRGTPVIYINFNYRLGPLGFPQGQEAADKGALNLGLEDQHVALDWVKSNVRVFGGDPDKVTVFGHSAGSIMTSIQYLNPDFANLARAAIFQSGYQATSPIFPPQYRQADWDKFVSNIPECASSTNSSFDCLQSANVTSESLIQAMAAVTDNNGIGQWAPVLDGPQGFLPDLPSNLYKAGRFARMPFIAGTELDEGTSFVPPTGLPFTDASMKQFILAIYAPPLPPYTLANLSSAADKLVQLYPDVPALGSPFGTGNETFGLDPGFKRFAALFGDLNFQSLRRLWINTATSAGVQAYGYEFTQPQDNGNASYLGVSHSSLVSYVYGTIPSDSSASDIKISQTIIEYWVSFATSLNPNDGKGIDRPIWREYKPESDEIIIQLNGNDTVLIPDTYRADQIDFINEKPGLFHH
uniref:Carboxylic ester hydrolase n=1 Tax=Moniliophthora roreri TaxID=221103 RepID=A0A0W0EUN4_MONRR